MKKKSKQTCMALSAGAAFTPEPQEEIYKGSNEIFDI